MTENLYNLHAREVRERLKGKVDPQLMYVLEALAEDNSKFKQQLVQFAQDLDQMTTIMQQIVQVGENMKSTVERLEAIEPPDDDNSPIR
jgi:division protein CdvB (Snf7/Vps24/ESCRT-III family)